MGASCRDLPRSKLQTDSSVPTPSQLFSSAQSDVPILILNCRIELPDRVTPHVCVTEIDKIRREP